MEFREELEKHIDTLKKYKNNDFNEEQTKMALILPFIRILGYDVYNPLEVIPEFIADIGEKKGEKVDYAICIDDKIQILIETKSKNDPLINHDIQLVRYFNVTDSAVGILTNGIVYKFFTDLDEKNRMDNKPFLEINLLNVTDNQIEELKKFHKKKYNFDNIMSSAEFLKYSKGIKNFLNFQLEDPSDEFVKILIREIYDGKITQNKLAEFKTIVLVAFKQFINDKIREKLENALEPNIEMSNMEETTSESLESEIITTDEEKECFYYIRSMLGKIVPLTDITYKDTKSYFNILYKNNVRKWICRIIFKSDHITFIFQPDVVVKISNIQEIYTLEEQLIDALKLHM